MSRPKKNVAFLMHIPRDMDARVHEMRWVYRIRSRLEEWLTRREQVQALDEWLTEQATEPIQVRTGFWDVSVWCHACRQVIGTARHWRPGDVPVARLVDQHEAGYHTPALTSGRQVV
jgi:hypothetical protein